jgi:hypothetical protein
LCVNNVWGKLAQREDLQKTEYFSEPDQYFKLIGDPTKEILTVNPLTDEMVSVTYRDDLDSKELSGVKTNPIIASFVTAYARLKLYEELEKLQERVLYMVRFSNSLVY